MTVPGRSSPSSRCRGPAETGSSISSEGEVPEVNCTICRRAQYGTAVPDIHPATGAGADWLHLLPLADRDRVVAGAALWSRPDIRQSTHSRSASGVAQWDVEPSPLLDVAQTGGR